MDWVYTWKKEIRITAKLPYVINAEREMPDGSGGKVIQKDDGFGDLTLALPLKKYFNLDGKSGSWTFKPMVRIPLTDKDEYDFYYKEFGTGLGAGYEAETANFFFGIGSGWPSCVLALISATISRRRNQTDRSSGKPTCITRTTNQRPYPPDRPFTSTITIPFIHASNGSSTCLITRASSTTETGM